MPLPWIEHFDRQPPDVQRKMAIEAIGTLILDEIFRYSETDDLIYWVSNGEDIREE